MPRQQLPRADARRVALRLRALRSAAGLKQLEIATRVGIAPQTWVLYEGGKSTPDLIPAIRICHEFNVTLDWLFLGLADAKMPAELVTRIEQEMRQTKQRRPKRKKLVR